MKIIIKIFAISLLLSAATSAMGQEKSKKVETVEFKVAGVCKMCEKRIENASLIKGVKLTEWNKETQLLKVIFKTKHTNKDAIQKAIAEAGHDTENVKATDDAYKQLPGCCAYRDGVEVH